MRRLYILLLIALLLTACQTAATATPASESSQTEEDVPSDEAAPEPEQPTIQEADDDNEDEEAPGSDNTGGPAATDLSPQTVSLTAADDTTLEGTFWPSDEETASGIVLMHWAPGDQTDWSDIALELRDGWGYAVLAFNFRGYGGSEGNRNDRMGMVQDAAAAIDFIKTLPNVAPDSVFAVGASIGADGAVDGCQLSGCAGAVSLSPGSYLGVPYSDALAAMSSTPVLCVAAEDDGVSPTTCESGNTAGTADYSTQIYPGRAHGMALFDQDGLTPPVLQLIIDWLQEQAEA
ncbi:MAG: alpha/beta hydrolase [Chloroflexi bacterium]|nr:alpha/beta hydrolase [Chloroflexota bacterium]